MLEGTYIKLDASGRMKSDAVLIERYQLIRYKTKKIIGQTRNDFSVTVILI
jgi:hypothetical protein